MLIVDKFFECKSLLYVSILLLNLTNKYDTFYRRSNAEINSKPIVTCDGV